MANEIQRITFNGIAIDGTFTLTFESETTDPLPNGTSAGTIQTALEALSTIGTGNVVVTNPISQTYDVEFTNALADQNLPLIVANSDLKQYASDPQITHTQTGIAPLTNNTSITQSNFVDGDESNGAVTTLTFSPIPNQGTWTVDGNTVNFNGGVNPTGYTGNGSAQSGTITFTSNSNGSGASPFTSYSNIDLQEHVTDGQPSIYTVTKSTDATDGQYIIQMDDSSTIVVDYDADLSTIQAAMVGNIQNYTASGSNPFIFTATSNFVDNSGNVASYSGVDPLTKPLTMNVTETQEGEPDEPPPDEENDDYTLNRLMIFTAKIDNKTTHDIAAETGKKLRVLSFFLSSAANATLQFSSKAANNSLTGLTGQMPITANLPVNPAYLGSRQGIPIGHFDTIEGESLRLVASQAVHGWITYMFI